MKASDKEAAPAVQQHPEARTEGGTSSMAKSIMDQDRVLRQVLREAVDRFNNELMEDSERQLLLDRIKRLRRSLKLA